jgi:hypothetical protein
LTNYALLQTKPKTTRLNTDTAALSHLHNNYILHFFNLKMLKI